MWLELHWRSQRIKSLLSPMHGNLKCQSSIYRSECWIRRRAAKPLDPRFFMIPIRKGAFPPLRSARSNPGSPSQVTVLTLTGRGPATARTWRAIIFVTLVRCCRVGAAAPKRARASLADRRQWLARNAAACMAVRQDRVRRAATPMHSSMDCIPVRPRRCAGNCRICCANRAS